MTPVAHHITVPRTARYITLGEIESAAEVWFVLHGYSMLAAGFRSALGVMLVGAVSAFWP